MLSLLLSAPCMGMHGREECVRACNRGKKKHLKSKQLTKSIRTYSTHWKLEFRFAHVRHWNQFIQSQPDWLWPQNKNNINKSHSKSVPFYIICRCMCVLCAQHTSGSPFFCIDSIRIELNTRT